MSIHSRQLLSSVLGLGLLFCLGCFGADAQPPSPAGPKGTVTGKVTHEGKPVTTGLVTFDSGKGYVAGAPLKPDGTFELKGPDGNAVPVGKYNVGVSPPPAATPAAGSTTMPPPPKIEGVPEKFYNPQTSGVTVEIKEGQQNLDVVLQ